MKIIESYLEVLDHMDTWLWREPVEFSLTITCRHHEDFFAIDMGIWGYELNMGKLDNNALYEPYYMFTMYFLRNVL